MLKCAEGYYKSLYGLKRSNWYWLVELKRFIDTVRMDDFIIVDDFIPDLLQDEVEKLSRRSEKH